MSDISSLIYWLSLALSTYYLRPLNYSATRGSRFHKGSTRGYVSRRRTRCRSPAGPVGSPGPLTGDDGGLHGDPGAPRAPLGRATEGSGEPFAWRPPGTRRPPAGSNGLPVSPLRPFLKASRVSSMLSSSPSGFPNPSGEADILNLARAVNSNPELQEGLRGFFTPACPLEERTTWWQAVGHQEPTRQPLRGKPWETDLPCYKRSYP